MSHEYVFNYVWWPQIWKLPLISEARHLSYFDSYGLVGTIEILESNDEKKEYSIANGAETQENL